MKCPVCKLDLIIVEVDGVELDTCLEGHGIWFDADEIRQLFLAADTPESLHGLEDRLTAPPPGDLGPRRRCLRCGKRMDHVAASGPDGPVVLDRCPRGHGLWFDEGELEQVVRGQVPEDDEAVARILTHLHGYGSARTED